MLAYLPVCLSAELFAVPILYGVRNGKESLKKRPYYGAQRAIFILVIR
ncbi:hypothetical protein JCM19237_6074 [Photobacterium aphoticum]|uniref:Uncharacterized protein n=1 Tax=Photobacterium aphoticum TaxID=754436 RepID=A0A090QJT2_9GAMM|nr:hypothetical protein JCM19237_6074 [Photobacterium aphoticum]